MIHFTPQTPLIDAMLADEDFFDRLMEHHPPTVKFQRVLNDEEVARELQLADVARMVDLPVATIVQIASGTLPNEHAPLTAEEPLATGWIDSRQDATTLDMRPIFEAGIEPLMTILREVAQLDDGDVLILEAPFHPLPLRRLLKGRSVDSFARETPSGSWQIALRRASV